MVLLIALIASIVLFIGGAYFFSIPITLGFLYAFNFTVIYLIIWFLANQCTKVFTQTMAVKEGCLVLAQKQIFAAFPILRNLDLQIPVDRIEEINLQTTRIGYLLTAQFNQDGKTMGVDLDINPLKRQNKVVLEQVMKLNPRIKVEEASVGILENYNHEALRWRASYTLSFFVVALAMVIFPIVSIILGSNL